MGWNVFTVLCPKGKKMRPPLLPNSSLPCNKPQFLSSSPLYLLHSSFSPATKPPRSITTYVSTFFCKTAEHFCCQLLASKVGFQMLDYFKKEYVYTHFLIKEEKGNDQLPNAAHSCYSNSSTACNTSGCSRL